MVILTDPKIIGDGGAATHLSQLEIDKSKDWLGYLIKNIGAPTAAGDALRKGTRVALAEMPDGTSGLLLTAQGAGVDPAYFNHNADTTAHPDKATTIDCIIWGLIG